MVVPPRLANPWKTRLRLMRPFWQTASLVPLGKGDSRLLASEVMQQVRQQQAGHQSHKPAITGESLKAGPVLVPEAVSQKCLQSL